MSDPKQILIPYSISDRARLVVIELDYQTSFAYRAGMVIEYDKSISSSVAQKQILIPRMYACLFLWTKVNSKDLQSTAELYLSFCFYSVLLDNIHSQNVPNIKTYTMTKSTRKIVILCQSRDRRLVLYFLLLAKSCEMISFSFQIS